MNVKFLLTKNLGQLVAELIEPLEPSTSSYKLSNPCTVQYYQGQNGKPMVAMMPLLDLTNEKILVLDSDEVIQTFEPNNDVVSNYTQQFGTILTTNPKIVVP